MFVRQRKKKATGVVAVAFVHNVKFSKPFSCKSMYGLFPLEEGVVKELCF